MQTLAPPARSRSERDARKLVEGYFLAQAAGAARSQRGQRAGQRLRSDRARTAATRLQRSARPRAYEVRRARARDGGDEARALELAKTGHGQIVAAVAEAGIGKSRLFYEFKASSQSGWMVLETFSVSHGKASAYSGHRAAAQLFRYSAEEDARLRREKVAGKVVMLDRALENALPSVRTAGRRARRPARWRRWTRKCASGGRWTRSSGCCCARASTGRWC